MIVRLPGPWSLRITAGIDHHISPDITSLTVILISKFGQLLPNVIQYRDLQVATPNYETVDTSGNQGPQLNPR